MNSKIYLIIGVLLISLVSAASIDIERSVQDKLREEGYQENLRNTDTINDCKGFLLSRTCKSYNSSEKRLLIEDWKNSVIIEGSLVGNYEKRFSIDEFNRSELWRIKIYDIDLSRRGLFDDYGLFDKKYNYRNFNKSIQLQYRVELNVTINCLNELIFMNGTIVETDCEEDLQGEWIDFNEASELPSNSNIWIRAVANVIEGERGELVFNFVGHEIIEWSEYIITSGPPFEFNGFLGLDNVLIHLANDTYYANVYRGRQQDGFVAFLKINITDQTIIRLDNYEFDNTRGQAISGIRTERFEENVTDTAHIFILYRDQAGDANVQTLEINFTSELISSIDTVAIDDSPSSAMAGSAMARIDDDDYFFVYSNQGKGQAFVRRVSNTNWTITDPSNGESFNFTGITPGTDNSISKINDSHFLVMNVRADIDGFLQVLEVDLTTFARSNAGDAFEFDLHVEDTVIIRLNKTHHIGSWDEDADPGGMTGALQVFEVNLTNWTVTNLGARTIGIVGTEAAMVKVNDTRYGISHRVDLALGAFSVMDLDLTDWSFEVLQNSTEFDGVLDFSLLQVGNNTTAPLFFFTTYTHAIDNDGFSRVFKFELDPCPPPSSGTWNLDCSLNCVFDTDELIVPGNISITGSGRVTFEVNVSMTSIAPHIEAEKDMCLFVEEKGVGIRALK